ncbi:MAG: glycosyltransferase family 1 protein [Candidatus Fermentibacteraceae bacterium]
MKMAFNLDYDYTRSTGIGRYGLELMSAWIELGHDLEVWKWRYFKRRPPLEERLESRSRYFPFPQRLSKYVWPSLTAKLRGVSWVHSANCGLLPGSRAFRQVCMVHDLSPFRMGHMKPDRETRIWRNRLDLVSREADCITVNSRSTMEDLLEAYPETEGRVFLTPLGIDHFATRRKASGPGRHLLTVGTVEPRKNIDGLLRAIALLRDRGKVLPLVIAGNDGYRAEENHRLCAELGLNGQVRFTGYVSDEELARLYANALCLVHVAHHEGFGIPVAEAFTWGLPVVASGVGGIGDFFSEAAWMVDPEDTESIAAGMEKALQKGVAESQRKTRERLRRELTWKKCARKTEEALRQLSP